MTVFSAFFYCISPQPNFIIELELHHVGLKCSICFYFKSVFITIKAEKIFLVRNSNVEYDALVFALSLGCL